MARVGYLRLLRQRPILVLWRSACSGPALTAQQSADWRRSVRGTHQQLWDAVLRQIPATPVRALGAHPRTGDSV
ncbi:hypothetical protein [Actinoplanes sp. L3-i22]|uniref:hypothetical protein n=1 Tax=Actinoplanes sp. L3-i22 TaxID=2836373 RepID=UPI001C8575D1|nr:hypothetical protein [Actinoplanes sp. L3-i22]